MANAVLSKKSKLEVKNTSSGTTFTKVNGFLSISGLGGGSAAVIDASDLDSDAKEKLIGLPDEGSPKVELNFLENDAGQDMLVAARSTQTLLYFKHTLNNGKIYSFAAHVLTAEPGLGVDQKITLSVGLEVTGPAVITKVTV